jgi:hypothetical protein
MPKNAIKKRSIKNFITFGKPVHQTNATDGITKQAQAEITQL